jgi:hypothetical protein
MRSMAKTIALATVLGVLTLLAPGRAEAIIINYKFGLVGVVFDADQAVQVNATHIGDPNIAPAPCTVEVEFFNGATGGLLKTAAFKLAPGQTRSAGLGFIDVLLKGKVPVYARVTMHDPNLKPACRPSLEVFDKGTGRTGVAIGDPNIRPTPEAFFPALTLVTGQVFRLNAVNVSDPNEAPCPILLTIFGAGGTVLGQQRAILASGAGTFLDVVVGDPNERVQLRATARRVVKSSDQTFCRAFVFSVEIYDPDGITTLLMDDPEL